MKKIATHHSTNTGAVPISTYHVEYEPQLIVRGTTNVCEKCPKKEKLILLRKLLLINSRFYKTKMHVKFK